MKDARYIRTSFVAAVALSTAAVPAFAEDAAPPCSLFLELNAAQASEKGCRLTFMVTSELASHRKHPAR